MPIVRFDALSRCSMPAAFDSESALQIDTPKAYAGRIWGEDSDLTAISGLFFVGRVIGKEVFRNEGCIEGKALAQRYLSIEGLRSR